MVLRVTSSQGFPFTFPIILISDPLGRVIRTGEAVPGFVLKLAIFRVNPLPFSLVIFMGISRNEC